MNFSSLFNIQKMCWPAYLYFFTYIITFAISIGYYSIYKKSLCSTQKIDDKSIDACIVECTTFNYFYNFFTLIIWTFILNLFCKFGSYVGWFIAFLIYAFSLIPLLYIIKVLMDKNAKQKNLTC